MFPTKEIFLMIEERIPGGRFLTTTALLLGLLAVIAASCSSLWQHIGSPIFNFVADAFRTGKIDLHQLRSFLVGVGMLLLVSFTVEFMVKTSSRLMRDLLNESKKVLEGNAQVLDHAEEVNQHIGRLAAIVQELETRVETLEER
jgi:hypothetical protein